jgi:uncharacterized DUF497 family protein
MDIEWDPGKARSNRAKHGVSFSDVEPAFYDPFALSMPDTFSASEERFVLVGTDALGRILTVSYAYRDEAVRIISARLATKSERKEYEKGIRL